jgi:hypothetical protein
VHNRLCSGVTRQVSPSGTTTSASLCQQLGQLPKLWSPERKERYEGSGIDGVGADFGGDQLQTVATATTRQATLSWLSMVVSRSWASGQSSKYAN